MTWSSTSRSDAKRVPFQRRSNIPKKEVRLVLARARLQSLLNEQDDSAEHSKRIGVAQKKIRSLENALKRQQLPSDFSEKLIEFVRDFEADGKGAMTSLSCSSSSWGEELSCTAYDIIEWYWDGA